MPKRGHDGPIPLKVETEDGVHHPDLDQLTSISPQTASQTLLLDVLRLRDSGHTVEELTDRLAEIKTEIRDWEDEFAVESPNQLRGTLTDRTLDLDEEDRRREIAREWEHL